MSAFALAAVLLGGDICSTLEAREPAADITVVGTVGLELRHSWWWVGNFGCADRIVLLTMSDASVRESEGGRELLSKVGLFETDMVNRSDFGPVFDIGIRVRLSGDLILAQDARGWILHVKEVDVLELGE